MNSIENENVDVKHNAIQNCYHAKQWLMVEKDVI